MQTFPNVFDGYVDSEMDRDALTSDGWLVTGDLGRFDKNGYLYLTGRAKDVIIRGSHNIDPAAIEEVAASHPAVRLCAAVGQLDRYAGEVPVLYVTLNTGLQANLEEEIRTFVGERVAEGPARPKHVYIVDEIPLTAVGKVFKPELRLDAARRAFEEALSPLNVDHPSVEVEVELEPDRGLVAKIRILATEDWASVEARAISLTSGFVATVRTETPQRAPISGSSASPRNP